MQRRPSRLGRRRPHTRLPRRPANTHAATKHRPIPRPNRLGPRQVQEIRHRAAATTRRVSEGLTKSSAAARRHVRRLRHRTLAGVLAMGAWSAGFAEPVEVNVQREGEHVIVDITTRVTAKIEIVWAVLTDYEHMASFLSALKTSEVLSRKGNELEVAQTGEAHRGPFHFSFSTVRAVELRDEREIRSHLIRGDFKSYEFTTRLVPGDAGVVTILNHGDYVPDAWVPPVIGPALIEAEARKQYSELVAEILRRQNDESTAHPAQ